MTNDPSTAGSRGEFLPILIVGVFLIVASAIFEYFNQDWSNQVVSSFLQFATTSSWWKMIGVPFLAGCAYVAIAVSAFMRRPTRKSALFIQCGCLVAAMILWTAVGGNGIVAVFGCAAALFVHIFEPRDA